jgi:hypothetical protein
MANAIMVNNKQVNFWRGDMTPPTIYHIWIKDNSKMLLYDGSKWVVFLDNKEIIEAIDKFQEALDDMQRQINEFGNKTVNKKPIKDNPVLDGTDLLIATNGNFVNNSDTVANTALKLDKLLTTQIFE